MIWTILVDLQVIQKACNFPLLRLSGGAVPVKLLVGTLPPEFRIEVTVVDGEGMEVDGNSEMFYMDDLLEVDGDKDAYGDRNISLNFEINGGESEIKGERCGDYTTIL